MKVLLPKRFLSITASAVFVLMFSIISIPKILFAQTGPGGVGSTSENILWLKADDLSLNNGDPVSSWSDASGNGNSVSQSTSDKQPTYQVNSSINNGPAIRFDGLKDQATGDELNAADGATLDGMGALTIFSVVNPSSFDGVAQGIVSKRSSQTTEESYSMFIYDNQNLYMDFPDSENREAATGYIFSTNTTAIASGKFDGSLANPRVSARVDGTGLTMGDGSVSITAIPNEPSSLYIGQLGGNHDTYFTGDMAEIIAYNVALNSAQQTIVENYLSTKYNVAISDDKYSYDTQYGDNLAGIGRESDGSHLSATSSNLNISLSAISNVGDYLMFGNNAADATTLATVSGDNFRDDNTNTLRLAREWKINLSGSFGDNVDVSFDTAGVTTGRPSDEWQWVLFIDNNGDGDFRDAGDSYVDLSINGTNVEATGASLSDGVTVTLGAIKREVQFSLSVSQGLENTIEFPTLNVVLNYPYAAGTDVDLSYTVAAGSADAADFFSSRNSATISGATSTIDLNNGATNGDAAIEVVDDSDQENTQTVTVTLNSATNAAIGSQNVHTYSILDDDEPRKISFSGATLNQTEGNSGVYTLSIDFNLTSQNAGVTQTASDSRVDINVTGGDATFGDLELSGTDAAIYDGIPPALSAGQAGCDSNDVTNGTNGTVTFNTITGLSTTPTTVSVAILQIQGDVLFENDETIELTLTNAQSCALGSQTTITITLANDETTPAVQFTSLSSSENENAGTVNVQVELSEATGTDVTVNFSDVGGTPAASGSDYSVLTSSPLTIPSGSTTGNIQLSISNDASEENDEQVVLTITGSSIDVGAQDTHTLTILDNDGLGNTGPAGIGDINSNILWLKADDISLSDGASVASWADASGNGNDVVQTSGIKQPTYQATSNINSGPAVRFTNSDGDELHVADNSTLDGMSGLSIYIIANPSSFSGEAQGLISKRVAPANDECYSLFIYSSNRLYFDMPGSSARISTSPYTFSAGSTALLSGVFDGSILGLTSRINGDDQTLGGTVSNSAIPDNSSSLFIGQLGGNESTYFSGDIAEIILFDDALNDARQIIVENYLAAKYGITISDDYYAGDGAGYTLDVAGIGTTDGTFANTHSSAANSAGLNISQRNASLNSTNEFVFIGHNSTTNGATTQDITGAIADARWGRSWYLDKTTTGTIDTRLTFDFSDGGIASSPQGDASNYILLYRANTSVDFSQLALATAINGDQVYFDIDDGQLSDGYYTLGTTNEGDSPLPVELVSYTLENGDGAIVLNWKTATEVDNLGFIIERSTEANSGFEQIASYQSSSALQGQGTVSVESNYKYEDYDNFQHGQTYYYRLSDVDISGNRNVLETKSITRPQAYSLEQNYPNPFNPVTTIQFSLEQPAKTVLEVYDILGRKVSTLINEELKAGSHIQTWDARNFASGVYFYRLQSGQFLKVKKMMLIK